MPGVLGSQACKSKSCSGFRGLGFTVRTIHSRLRFGFVKYLLTRCLEVGGGGGDLASSLTNHA